MSANTHADAHTDAHHHPSLAHHFENFDQQHGAMTLGMWAFLVTEVMIFGPILFAYALYRSVYFYEFEAASHLLKIELGAGNTAVLILSSLTMALAVRASQLGQRQNTVTYLLLTILLGTAFLGVKAYEWYDEYEHHVVPVKSIVPVFKNDWPPTHEGTPLSVPHIKMFYVFYFILTGLHATHMIIGIGLLGVLAWQTHKGYYSAQYNSPIEMSGLYWHFVDIAWIFLFPLLYLVGERVAGGH